MLAFTPPSTEEASGDRILPNRSCRNILDGTSVPPDARTARRLVDIGRLTMSATPYAQTGPLIRRVRMALVGPDLQRVTGDSFTIAAKPAMVKVARDHVAAALGDEHPCLDAAKQAIAELVSNAIRHGSASERCRIRVTVRRCRRRRVVLTVTDEGGTGRAPTLRRADEGAVCGRGLSIVASFAARWSVIRCGAGHRVRVLLRPDETTTSFKDRR
jgi:anti-sigma regulatory factor (Ser/Thr protein kinase)